MEVLTSSHKHDHRWEVRGRKQGSRAEVEPSFSSAVIRWPRLISEVLRARGVSSESEIEKWLSPSLKSLKDPFLLKDMDRAVQRLVQAFENKESICVYADYDLDGTSGLALLLRALGWMGFERVSHYQPKRLSEGYGLHKEAIASLGQNGHKLIVTVDLGISAYHEVAYAKELGIDVIVTDHHLPQDLLPPATAVVNPNRKDCSAGLNHLCGAGVAFYLVLALRRSLLEQGLIQAEFDPKKLLDCFAIATLTDMVPLVDENRVLVKHGLLQLAGTDRPGLRILLQELGLTGTPLNGQDVAIRFAPKLNALSRMESGLQPLELYLVDSDREGQRLVKQVMANNQHRQLVQKNAEDEAFEAMKSCPPGACIFTFSSGYHRGVLGLVATKLCQHFARPAFVGSLDEAGVIVGSVRIPDGMQVSALEAMNAASEFLDHFGGHAKAAGFELKEVNADKFGGALESFFSSHQTGVLEKTWSYDAEAKLGEFNSHFMAWFDHLGPFGTNFATPVFLVRDLRVVQVRTLKGGHLRLTLTDSPTTARVALWFSPPKDHSVLCRGLEPMKTVDVLVEPQRNYYQGQRSIQLLIHDLREASRQ